MREDVILQLRYEIFNRPNSCVTVLVVAWYNSLANELSTIDEFDCCEVLECETDCVEEIDETLPLIPITSIETLLLNYFINQLIDLGVREGKRFLRQFERSVRRNI